MLNHSQHPSTTPITLVHPLLIVLAPFLYYKFIIMQKTKAISKSELRANRRCPPKDLCKETSFHNSPILEQQTILSILNDTATLSYNDGCLSILNFIRDLRSQQNFHYYAEDEDQMDETDSKKIKGIEEVNLMYRQAMNQSQGRRSKNEKRVSFREETSVRCFTMDNPPSQFLRYEEDNVRLEKIKEEVDFSQE